MLDTDLLWRFFLLWLIAVPTSGANSLLVTHLSLTRPATHVGFALVGHIAGVMLLSVCAMLGWAALLDAFPWLRIAVNVFGGAYLIYCGSRLLGRARSSDAATVGPKGNNDAIIDRTEPAKAIMIGFATAISNAQAILFMTSIFAVSGVLATNTATNVAVLGIIAACNLSYLGLLGWLFRRPAIRAGYRRFRRWFEGTIGALFVVFGGRLILRVALR